MAGALPSPGCLIRTASRLSSPGSEPTIQSRAMEARTVIERAEGSSSESWLLRRQIKNDSLRATFRKNHSGRPRCDVSRYTTIFLTFLFSPVLWVSSVVSS